MQSTKKELKEAHRDTGTACSLDPRQGWRWLLEGPDGQQLNRLNAIPNQGSGTPIRQRAFQA